MKEADIEIAARWMHRLLNCILRLEHESRIRNQRSRLLGRVKECCTSLGGILREEPEAVQKYVDSLRWCMGGFVARSKDHLSAFHWLRSFAQDIVAKHARLSVKVAKEVGDQDSMAEQQKSASAILGLFCGKGKIPDQRVILERLGYEASHIRNLVRWQEIARLNREIAEMQTCQADSQVAPAAAGKGDGVAEGAGHPEPQGAKVDLRRFGTWTPEVSAALFARDFKQCRADLLAHWKAQDEAAMTKKPAAAPESAPPKRKWWSLKRARKGPPA